MATGQSYLTYLLEQLAGVPDLTFRPMMGEYILYIKGKIAAYVCDDRLLIKPVKAAIDLLPNPVYQSPYPGAKEMIVVEQTDDAEFLQRLFLMMEPELPIPKAKTKK